MTELTDWLPKIIGNTGFHRKSVGVVVCLETNPKLSALGLSTDGKNATDPLGCLLWWLGKGLDSDLHGREWEVIWSLDSPLNILVTPQDSQPPPPPLVLLPPPHSLPYFSLRPDGLCFIYHSSFLSYPLDFCFFFIAVLLFQLLCLLLMSLVLSTSLLLSLFPFFNSPILRRSRFLESTEWTETIGVESIYFPIAMVDIPQ